MSVGPDYPCNHCVTAQGTAGGESAEQGEAEMSQLGRMAMAREAEAATAEAVTLDERAVFVRGGPVRHVVYTTDGELRPVTLCCVSARGSLVVDGRTAQAGQVCPRCLQRARGRGLVVDPGTGG
jgi:hypothetical protein